MKKIIILCLMAASISLHAKTETTRTRGQIWTRAAFSGIFTDFGLGVFTMISSRYNFATKGQVATPAVSDYSTIDGAWNQQAWLGPQWTISYGFFTFTTKPLYLFSAFFIDEVAQLPNGAVKHRYYRHTFDWFNDFIFKFSNVRLFYRLRFMNCFPTITGDGADLDNELMNRHALGISIPIHKYISLFFMEEIFFKLTASDTDKDGTEIFAKNALWGGLIFKIHKGLSMRLNYAFFYNNTMNTETKSTQVFDHYINLDLRYSLDLRKSNKKKK